MTETNLVPIILSTGGTLLAAIIAATGVLAAMLRGMNASMNRRFDDAQRTTDKRFDNAERTTNERFNEAQHANDQAHAGITENILRVERQQDAGLNRLYGLLFAIVPRAAAEVPPGDKA